MNRQALQAYITDYKINFSRVSLEEIYKWKAVKCFQDNWDSNSANFHAMLEASMKLTENLLSSGQYFPLRMLLFYSAQKPNELRALFEKLFDEEVDLYSRINRFQAGIEEINTELYQNNKKSYQDLRAIVVYLTLKYPERYFFYKFRMFAEYSKNLDLAYTPKIGQIENLGYFNSHCEAVRYELALDQDLLKLHKDRIEQDCYYDENLNILTQDFIYFVSRNSVDNRSVPLFAHANSAVFEALASDFAASPIQINFNGRNLNYAQQNAENKYLGNRGEDWVIKYEKEKLEKANKGHLISRIIHSSRTEGDGTGFDIQSFDEDGKEILIEVKTTKGSKNSTIFLTRNELERSRIDSERYYLYRVYNFDEKAETADLLILKGSLTNLCTNPATYTINLRET